MEKDSIVSLLYERDALDEVRTFIQKNPTNLNGNIRVGKWILGPNKNCIDGSNCFHNLTAQQIAEKNNFHEIVALFNKTSQAKTPTNIHQTSPTVAPAPIVPANAKTTNIHQTSPTVAPTPALTPTTRSPVPTLAFAPTPASIVPANVSEWTTEHVVKWSSQFLKSDLVNVLRKQELTGSSLLKLKVKNLISIFGFPYGTASDFIDQINKLKTDPIQNIPPSKIVTNTGTFNGGGMSNYRQTLSPDHSILKMASIVAGAKPQFDCIHSLQLLTQFPVMPKIEMVIEECNEWYEGWKYDDDLNPYGLDKDEVFAIVSYTHDLYNKGQKEENFYFQLNEFLRRRLQSEMETWSSYLYYILTALKKLPDVEITIYRGIPASSMSKIQKEYKQNRPIHWSGFSSSSNNKDVAKQFAGTNGIIFSIKIYTGKDIKSYSFVRSEDETLLSPNMKFKVTRSLYDGGDGFHYVELEEEQKVFVY